jgi:hypothetical protein
LVGTGAMLKMLKFLDANYAEDPSSYIHVLSPAVYSGITAANVHNAVDVAEIIKHLDTDATIGRPAQTANVAVWCEIVAKFGIADVCAYEGGPALYPSLGVGGVDATDMTMVQAAHDSVEMEAHIKGQVHDWLSKGGKEFAYFNIGAGPVYTNYTNGNSMWHCTTALSGGSIGKKLKAVLDLMAYPVPPAEAITARNMAPGALTLGALTNVTISPLQYITHDGSAPTSWPMYFNVGWFNRVAESLCFIDYSVYVAVAKTYAITPRVSANGTATMRILIDGVECWNSGPTFTTNTRPSTAEGVRQAPFNIALSMGWHAVRLECTPHVTNEQYGFGPVVFE